jgi:hypothetical protein
MVTFGIEVIENFDEYNKGIADKKYHVWTPNSGAKPLYSGFIKALKKHHLWSFGMFDDGSGKGHTKIYESDLHDSKTGGRDDYRADGVELFIFNSHGNHTKDYHSLVAFNSSKAGIGTSRDWKLGDTRLRWLMIKACRLIVIEKVLALLPMFQGLRMYCGSYWSIGFNPNDSNAPGMFSHADNDYGENIGEMLNDGQPVSSSWVYGFKDDEFPSANHPMVVTAEYGHTLPKNESDSWKLKLSTLNTDTISSSKDGISPQDIKWLNCYWVEI